MFRLAFGYSEDLVARVRLLPHALFDKETKSWTCTLCTQSVNALRSWHAEGLTDVAVDVLIDPNETVPTIANAMLRPGTARRPYLVQTAFRGDDALFSRLRAVPGSQWEAKAGAMSYPPYAATKLAELVDRGVVDDPQKLLSPAAVTVTFDTGSGRFIVRGDQRAAKHFDTHFPGRDVMGVWAERGLDVAFADDFSSEVYLAELARAEGRELQPAGMALDLYPYQRRDLAVLVERSGMSLMSSMGVGKCLHKDTRVWVNGDTHPIEELWNRFASSGRIDDGEGEWATPNGELLVHSVDDDWRAVQAPVARLYRQRVREQLRRITLSDGSQVTITRAHRLLREDGEWTTVLAAGDRVAVPRTLAWTGPELDEDLVTVLAWQISAGHENPDGPQTIRITQTDTATLERIRAALIRYAAKHDVPVGRCAIHSPAEGVSHLTFTGRHWQEHLAGLGYTSHQLPAGKQIPSVVMQAGPGTTALFLREFFTAEGSAMIDTRHAEITTASPLLGEQLRMLLVRAGVTSRWQVKWSRANDSAEPHRHPPYTGHISGAALRTFRDSVGFADPVKQTELDAICPHPIDDHVDRLHLGSLARTARRNDLSWAEIVSTEVVDYDDWVYDLEVPAHHNFVANGVLCHNTAVAIATAHEVMVNRGEVPRTVVVVPPAVRTQWRNEIIRFTGCDPDDVVVVDGAKKKRLEAYARAKGAKWLVVHYQAVILADDTKALRSLVPGAFLIADEAHRLKNHDTKTFKVMRGFAQSAKRRLALTGTPVENNPGEWYSVLSGFAIPGLFGSPIDYLNRYSFPAKFGGFEGARNIGELRDRSKPHYIRHTLAEVAPDMPPMRVQTVHLDPRPEYAAALSRAHREARDEIAAQRVADAEARSKRTGNVLDGYDREDLESGAEMTAVGMLKTLCSSPRLLHASDSEAAKALCDAGLVPDEDGPKIDEVRVMAAEMAANGERVVVFTSSKRMANLIAERLDGDQIRYVLYTGDTKAAERDAAVAAFTTPATETDPGPTVFVATDAGAEGLNLGRCCSTLVNCDIPWTPGRLGQRNGRVRRVDSTANGFLIVNLVLRGTIEEGILRMVEHKADLADALFGESGGRALTTGRRGRNIFEAAMADWTSNAA